MLAIRAVSRFLGLYNREPVSGRRLQRLLLPMLLCGMGVALPVEAAVTQTPGNDVTPGDAVEYVVTTGFVPPNGYVHIGVQNNGGDITTQLASPDNSCSDAATGVIYCDGSGTYTLAWVPPSGINYLAFSETVYDSTGSTVSQVTEYLTTAVGTESLGLTVSAKPTTYTKVGDVITYTYTLTNTGSLALGATTVTDSRLGTISGCAIADGIAVKGSVTCSKTYTVTQAP